MRSSFPPGFVWGTATASYQIEGAVNEDGRGPSIWDTFSRIPGNVANGDTGDTAIDHYHRYEADVEEMSRLGTQSYRFSIAWPRVQPDGKGAVNEKGLDFYRRLTDRLLDHGIAPAVTLYHWDLPQALQDEGGWTNRDTAERFADYAATVHQALGDRIRFWITLNEPWCSSYLGYHAGEHAPGRTNVREAVLAVHHLLLAHGRALEAMRGMGGDDQRLGITLNLWTMRPATDSPEDVWAACQTDAIHNRAFLDPLFKASYPDEFVAACERLGNLDHIHAGDLDTIAGPIDFLGINFYNGTVLRHGPDGPHPPGPGLEQVSHEPNPAEKTAMGWPIEPQQLEALLLRIHRDYPSIPLYITENGAAFHDYVDPEGRVIDAGRVAFLDGHLRAALRAIEQGVDLRGFYVWSLFDNFEWAWGYSRRFGLIYVDYPSQRRVWKQSAHWYRDVIARNGLAGEPVELPGARASGGWRQP